MIFSLRGHLPVAQEAGVKLLLRRIRSRHHALLSLPLTGHHRAPHQFARDHAQAHPKRIGPTASRLNPWQTLAVRYALQGFRFKSCRPPSSFYVGRLFPRVQPPSVAAFLSFVPKSSGFRSLEVKCFVLLPWAPLLASPRPDRPTQWQPAFSGSCHPDHDVGHVLGRFAIPNVIRAVFGHRSPPIPLYAWCAAALATSSFVNPHAELQCHRLQAVLFSIAAYCIMHRARSACSNSSPSARWQGSSKRF